MSYVILCVFLTAAVLPAFSNSSTCIGSVHCKPPIHQLNSSSDLSMENSTMSKTFKYFAFGSNLLTKRMHYQNPTATRYDIGLLEGYRLDFGGYYSERWHGYVANVVPDKSAQVWGAIWDVGMENKESLDRQEGVHLNIYRPIDVTVKTPKGEAVTCRCYSLVLQKPPQKQHNAPSGLPELPSKVYLTTIINGAKESQLPADYIKKLADLPDNGFNGEVNLNSEQ